MAKTPDGFVSLKSLKQGPASPRDALARAPPHLLQDDEAQTIEHDFAHAIELLKSLQTEEEREKATVYMHGLAEMQRNWAKKRKLKSGRSGKVEK